jgi:hypothetical protein
MRSVTLLDDAELEWAALWKPLPKVVFSTTLSAVQGNARLASGGLAEEIERPRTNVRPRWCCDERGVAYPLAIGCGPAIAQCPAGKKVLGGGFGGTTTVSFSFPTNNNTAWVAGGQGDHSTYAICAIVGP